MAGIRASPEGARPRRGKLPPGTGHLLPARTREIMDFLETAHA
ncbi:hypothetical protein ACIBI9_29085 [Nonomuraea sp. NPDC050451]